MSDPSASSTAAVPNGDPPSPSPSPSTPPISPAEFVSLQQQLMTVKEQLYETKRQAEVAMRDKINLQQDIEKLRAEKPSTKSKFASFMSKDGGRVKELEATLEETKRAHSAQLAEYKEQMSALKQNMSLVFAQNNDLKDECERLRAAMATAPSKPLTEDVGELQSRIVDLERELAAIKSENEKLSATAVEKENRIQAVLADSDRIVDRLTAKEHELKQVRDESDLKSHEIERLRTQLQDKSKPLINTSFLSSPIKSISNSNNLASSPSAPTTSTSTTTSTTTSPTTSSPPPTLPIAQAIDTTFDPTDPNLTPTSPSAAYIEHLPVIPGEEATRIFTLEEEVGRLKMINEHVIASIQKKDATIRTNHEDVDRFLNKLTEKEHQVMQMRDAMTQQQAQITNLQAELKARDATIKKLESSDNTGSSKKVTAMQEQFKIVIDEKERMARELETAKTELEEMKDRLFIAEQQVADSSRLVESQDEMCNGLRTIVAAHEQQISTLTIALEQNATTYAKHLEELEKRIIDDQDLYQASYKHALQEWESSIAQLKSQIITKNNLLSEREDTILELERKFEESKNSQSDLQRLNNELREQHDKMQAELTEIQSTQKIEARKRNQMLNELKAQLKRETFRAKELEAQLAEAMDNMREQPDIPVSASSRRLLTPNGSPDTPTSFSHQQSPVSSQPVDAIDAEVSAALATRLAQVQDEYYNAKRQVGALQERITLLEQDVSQKKDMIRNFVRRIETGALSTDDTHGAQHTSSQKLSPQLKEELFDKMETLLQETTLQNIQLKEQIKTIGAEVLRVTSLLDAATTTNSTLQSELDTIREKLQELQDEKELIMMTTEDAQKLVRVTETKVKQQDEMINHLQIQLKQVQEELEAKKLASSSSVSSEVATLTSRCTQFQHDLDMAHQHDKETQIQFHSIQKQYQTLKEAMINAEEEIRKYKDELKQVKGQLQKQQPVTGTTATSTHVHRRSTSRSLTRDAISPYGAPLLSDDDTSSPHKNGTTRDNDDDNDDDSCDKNLDDELARAAELELSKEKEKRERERRKQEQKQETGHQRTDSEEDQDDEVEADENGEEF